MSNVQIPNLPGVVGLSGAELFEGVQAGTSVKIGLDQIIAATRAGTPTTLPIPVAVGGTGVTDAFSSTSVSTLLADTSFTYTTGQVGSVVAGNIIQARKEGFSYRVAASGAADQHVTTAGGVKLYVIPGTSGYDVTAFGAVGDGVTDDTVAIQKAVSVSFNKEFFVPTGTYLLSANVLGNLAQIQNMAPGVTFLNFGVYNCAIFEKKSGGQSYVFRSGLPGTGSAVGEYATYFNLGTEGGYGRRIDYIQQGTQTTGSSIADGIIADFKNTNGASGFASWIVSGSPRSLTATFGVICQEMNPVNLSEDTGYKRKRGYARWTGGLQIVPETQNFFDGGPRIGKNTTFGFAVTPSGYDNILGKRAKTYTGLMIEENSIGPDGRGISAQGADTAVDLPMYPLQVDANWQAGIDTQEATFSTNRAFTMAAGQTVQWGTTTYPTGITGDNTTGTLDFFADGATNFQVERGGASVVNYIKVKGNASTGNPIIVSEGSDTNISISIESKNSGAVLLKPGGITAAQFGSPVSAVNFFNIFGNTAGASPAISVVGSDTNIDLTLSTKGTGRLRFGALTASGDVPVTGYIEIKDAGGTVRRLAVVG